MFRFLHIVLHAGIDIDGNDIGVEHKRFAAVCKVTAVLNPDDETISEFSVDSFIRDTIVDFTLSIGSDTESDNLWVNFQSDDSKWSSTKDFDNSGTLIWTNLVFTT